MKKMTMLMFALLFALSVPLVVQADNGGKKGPEGHSSCMKHKGMEGRHDGHMGREGLFKLPWFYLSHAKDLKLTDEQKASLKKMSFDLKKDMIAKGADVKVKRLELREMLSTPDYKLEDATAKLKEISDARLALTTALLQYTIQARDVLTPDQLKSVKDLCRHGQCGKCGGKGMKRHMRDKKDNEGQK